MEYDGICLLLLYRCSRTAGGIPPGDKPLAGTELVSATSNPSIRENNPDNLFIIKAIHQDFFFIRKRGRVCVCVCVQPRYNRQLPGDTSTPPVPLSIPPQLGTSPAGGAGVNDSKQQRRHYNLGLSHQPCNTK